MEDGIYRMSLMESLLVLIVIGLWFLAIVNLVRKFERICNPPSIFLNYSTHNNLSFSPSTIQECYENTLLEPTTTSSVHITRATSEPAIDELSRASIQIRSPIETCIQTNTSISTRIPTDNIIEGSATSSHQTDQQNRFDIISIERSPCPKYIPKIVKQSLLDLHRRALFSNTSFPTMRTRELNYTTENRMTTRFSLRKKRYQRENAIDEGDFYRNREATDSM
ncbi:hypothetical protein I4U23_012445 [Adineta vaga]|nr:hypothetical protein I4U23_012445 [Adineta vaga]